MLFFFFFVVFFFFFFQAEDGIRYKATWLEFRRVLFRSTLPYVIQLANEGWEKACKKNKALSKGLNIVKGKIVYKEIAEAFEMEMN